MRLLEARSKTTFIKHRDPKTYLVSVFCYSFSNVWTPESHFRVSQTAEGRPGNVRAAAR